MTSRIAVSCLAFAALLSACSSEPPESQAVSPATLRGAKVKAATQNNGSIPCAALANAITATAGDVVLVNSGTMVDSYNSANGPYGGNNVGSNGNIVASGRIVNNGGIIRGTQSPNTVSNFPTLSAPSGALNLPLGSSTPGSLNINIASDSITLAPGTYVVQYLNVNYPGAINISPAGAVTIYVTGGLNLGGKEDPNGVPSNMTFVVTPSVTTNVNSNGALVGNIYAPTAAVNLNSAIYGYVVGAMVTLNSGSAVHYDTSLSCSIIDNNTIVAARAGFAAAVGDVQLQDFFVSILSSFSTALSPYQIALLNLATYLNANADLLADPSQLNAAQLARLPAFLTTIRGSTVVQAIVAAGQNLQSDPASYAAAINAFIAGASASTTSIPPAPAESCGGVQPTARTLLNQFINSPATQTIKAAMGAQAKTPGFGSTLSAVGASVLVSTSVLSNLTLPTNSGGVQPIFSLLNTIKGGLEVAAGVVAVAVVCITTPESETILALGLAAGALSIGAGAIDLYEGITQPNDSSPPCPGTAPSCIGDSNCGSNVCSYGCCVTRQAASKLVESGLVECAIHSDCPSNGSFCASNGCCEIIL